MLLFDIIYSYYFDHYCYSSINYMYYHVLLLLLLHVITSHYSYDYYRLIYDDDDDYYYYYDCYWYDFVYFIFTSITVSNWPH